MLFISLTGALALIIWVLTLPIHKSKLLTKIFLKFGRYLFKGANTFDPNPEVWPQGKSQYDLVPTCIAYAYNSKDKVVTFQYRAEILSRKTSVGSMAVTYRKDKRAMGMLENYEPRNAASFLELIKRDGLRKLRFYDLLVPHREAWPVAAFFNTENSDPHFIRMDKTGEWSEKIGANFVTQKGSLSHNPFSLMEHSTPAGKYVFHGFWVVNPRILKSKTLNRFRELFF